MIAVINGDRIECSICGKLIGKFIEITLENTINGKKTSCKKKVIEIQCNHRSRGITCKSKNIVSFEKL